MFDNSSNGRGGVEPELLECVTPPSLLNCPRTIVVYQCCIVYLVYTLFHMMRGRAHTILDKIVDPPRFGYARRRLPARGGVKRELFSSPTIKCNFQ